MPEQREQDDAGSQPDLTETIAERGYSEGEPPSGGRHGPLLPRTKLARFGPPATLGAILVLVLWAYSAALTPTALGYYNDDAIYLTTAKALATGQGYRIIGLPGEPAQTKYPPVYPLILSIVWRLKPAFPANVKALMLISVLASIAAAVLTWVYLTRFRYASHWLAIVIVGLAAINSNTLRMSINALSEMLYAAISIGALLLAEQYEETERPLAPGLALGVVIGLSFLTRIAGITVLVAIAFYLLINKKLKRAVTPVAVASLMILAWWTWVHYYRTPGIEKDLTYYTDYLRYSYDLVRNSAISENRSLFGVMVAVVKRNVLLLVGYWSPTVTLGQDVNWISPLIPRLQPLLLRGILLLGLLVIGLGMRRYRLPRWRLLPIYVLFYLALHVCLPYRDNSYDRYVVPILPFLILFFITSFGDAARVARAWIRGGSSVPKRTVAALTAAALLLLTGFAAFSYFYTVSRAVQSYRPEAESRRSQDIEAMAWVRTNLPKSAVIACVHPAMYYLYTGHESVLCFSSEGPARLGLKRQVEELTSLMARDNAHYLVLTDSDLASRAGGVDYINVVRQLTASRTITPVFIDTGRQAVVFQYNWESPVHSTTSK